MKKKKFKPNLPGHPENSDDKTQPTSFISANEDLYNKFIEEERIEHKVISVTKPLNEKGSKDSTKEFHMDELIRK